MNNFLKYLRSHFRVLAFFMILCIIFLVSFSLYHLPLKAVLYPVLLSAAVGLIFIILDYLRTRKVHKSLERIKSVADLSAENVSIINGAFSDDLEQLFRLISEEHNAFCTENERRYSDMVDYYTVWAHQIKTPIASMRLTLQNEDSELSRRLSAELMRIEQYVEMVLTFIRLNSDSTDYLFREYELDKIVSQSLRKFSSEFINRKLKLTYEPLKKSVVTDEKWLSFVIEQVISNSLKYTHSGGIIISLSDEKTLCIKDTGIGIAAEDLPRVFENGYTGCNGRTDKKASGIGLYLCKRICNNLGHSITIESNVDVGTAVYVHFLQKC